MINKDFKINGGIYIHIPFCMKKCAYCDFYSISDLSLESAFVESLAEEIKITSQSISFPFDTIYIGGGTPSVLQEKSISRIIKTAYNYFTILPDSEITIEANPGTVSPESLKAYHDAGINRINFGVQSFNDENLRFLDRIHSSEDAEDALKWAQEAGFKNIGLDLIYGLPGQSEEHWIGDLKRAVEWNPAHISCYMLTYEHGTLLDIRRNKGEIEPLGEEESGNLFETTIDFLNLNGYRQYEISNFARSEKERSRHNQKYWSFAPYIGLGPAAHSFIPPERRWNCRSVKEYIKALNSGKPPVEEKEILTREQEIMEAVYIGLRKTEGILINDFDARFGISFLRVFRDILPDLKAEGMINYDSARCALSSKGMRFLDSITSLFIYQDFSG